MKPNILFISCFKQYDGWGLAAKDYARALSTVANVTIRNIYLSNSREEKLPQDLQVLEDTKYNNYDIVIQKTLPNLYYYDGRFKQNIGMTVFETELSYHNWFNNMNLMDKMLVPSKIEANWLKNKLKNQVFNVSEALDINIADKNYPIVDDALGKKLFKFLFIGENIPRKGIRELIQAYFSAFTVNDNVLLIIKSNGDITKEVSNIKNGMRRFVSDTKYPPIYFISHRLNNEQIYSLHQNTDVLVMPSYGEAFNRPAATSLIFGKPVIATDNTGMTDYLNSDIGWLVKSNKEQVFCTQPPLQELYTSQETYYVPNILNLKECMQSAFFDKNAYNLKCFNILDSKIKEKFSYESVGKNILEAIEA